MSPLLAVTPPPWSPPPWWGHLPPWVQNLVTYYLRRTGVIPKP